MSLISQSSPSPSPVATQSTSVMISNEFGSLALKAKRFKEQQDAFEEIICLSRSNLEELTEKLNNDYITVPRCGVRRRRKIGVPISPINDRSDDEDEVDLEILKSVNRLPLI